MPSTTSPFALFGRERELDLLAGLIDGAGTKGGALVVRGEAGIGKSALLLEAARHAKAHELQVLTTTGVQSEAHLAFAGLHHLLQPALTQIETLPPPQRAAMAAAFGLSEEAAPDIFLIALAALELLADIAARSPLLLVIDDAQWLDPPTCEVLAFVARRIELEPIVLLLAVREGFGSRFEEAGLPELPLGPLDGTAADALLDAHAPNLAHDVRERLTVEADGNPLALLELPFAIDGEHRDGWLPPEPLPLTARLEQAFAGRIAELPKPTRTLLLVASLDHAGDLGELIRSATAVEQEEVHPDAFVPAEAARLVAIEEGGMRFRHPLVRSAIYQASTVSERQAAHAALAVTLADDPDQSVWHRAASVSGPEPEVAAELEAAAARAFRRGAIQVAMAALERAAQLTVDPARRGALFVQAAELAFDLGRPELGVRLLREAEPLALDPQTRTWLSWFLELFDRKSWSGADRVASFTEIAKRMTVEGQHDRALAALQTIGLRLWWGNPDQATRDLVVAAAESIPIEADNPALIAVLALADPIGRGRVVADRISAFEPDSKDPVAMFDLGSAATAVWAYDRSAGFLSASVAGFREQGRLGLLAQALVTQAWTEFHLGEPDRALTTADEGTRLAWETTQPRWEATGRLAQAAVAATQGRFGRAGQLAVEAERLLLPMGANPMLALVQLVRGTAALADGRHRDSYEELKRMFDPDDVAHHPFVRWWGAADLVEAAVRSGHGMEAGLVLAELEELLAQTGASLLRTQLNLARSVAAEPADAEALFQTGLADDSGGPFVRARLLLGYGSWLRRERRIAESRVPLKSAREVFTSLGYQPWAERANQELRASGETSRSRRVEAWDQLSPQELQIAQMAADGLTNREIGQRLYLSHRTVSSHLHRIFPKLRITSRLQLDAALRTT